MFSTRNPNCILKREEQLMELAVVIHITASYISLQKSLSHSLSLSLFPISLPYSYIAHYLLLLLVVTEEQVQ